MKSINIVTVKTLTDITPQLGYNYLENFGITSLQDSDIVQSLALGGITKGVSNLELTAAFATIANGGIYTEPVFYTKILDHDGNVLIDNTPETRQVLKETTAFLLTDAMEDVVTKGTGTAVNFGTTAIAGKTGTTDDSKDAYFIGFTPDVVTGVWVGNDDNSQMGGITGGTVPALIWKDVMTVATEPYGNDDFEYPEVILNPFKASSVSIINQNDAKKAFEEQEAEKNKENEESADNQVIKPDSIKPAEILQQTLTPIKKKEIPTVEVKQERSDESPAPVNYAPIPMTSAPIGQQ